MSGRIVHWDVVYIHTSPLSPSAKEDSKRPGLYVHKEVIAAITRAEVVREVTAKGGVVTKVTRRKGRSSWRDRINDATRQQMMLTLYFGVQGGLSAGKALEQYILQQEGPIRGRLNLGLDVLRKGGAFSEAMRSIGVFDEPTLAIIEAGESMGRLKDALQACRQHLEKAAGSNKLIAGAIGATSLDLVVAVTTIIGVRFQMIPSLRAQGVQGGPAQKAAFETALDNATLGNDIMIGLTILIIFAVIGAVVAYFSADEKVRARVDMALGRVPLLGQMLEHSALASTCAVMGSLLKGGVMFLPACDITLRATRHHDVLAYWRRAKLNVTSGIPVARALSLSPMSMNEQAILQSHQDSYQLAESFVMISAQRLESAAKVSKKFAYALFWITTGYALIGVALTFYVVWIQNQGVMNGIGG